MTCADGRHRRPGYILLVAIAALALLVIVAVVLAKCAAIDVRRERTVALESAGEQALQSARAWSRIHADTLDESETVTLPMDGWISPGVTGSAELRLRQGDGEAARVECRLELRRGRLRLTRQVSWPAAEAASGSPVADPATP
jgi:hypothetical protein